MAPGRPNGRLVCGKDGCSRGCQYGWQKKKRNAKREKKKKARSKKHRAHFTNAKSTQRRHNEVMLQKAKDDERRASLPSSGFDVEEEKARQEDERFEAYERKHDQQLAVGEKLEHRKEILMTNREMYECMMEVPDADEKAEATKMFTENEKEIA